MNRLQITCARALCLLLSAFVCAGLLPQAAPTGAQQQQKDKKNKNKKDAAADGSSVTSMMSEEQQIDVQISTMLGGWQINDLEKMRQTYADDVILVSGNWAPPIVGWSNFATMYQQQRAHMQQVRMDRSNTYIKVKGTFAWACYQWEFSANVDGQASAARGQTTLVFQKDNGRWLIVHNHTSLVQAAGALAPFRPDGTPSTQPPPQH